MTHGQWRLAALALCLLALVQAGARAEPRKSVLIDFEDEVQRKAFEQPPRVEVVSDHATSGTHALKCTLTAGWLTVLNLTDEALLRPMADYRTLALDFYNPSDRDIHLFAQIYDALAMDGKESRFASDWLFVPPGRSTLRFSLSCLPRLWPHEGANVLDVRNLRKIWLFTGDDTRVPSQPIVFYLDNIRLEDSGVVLPQVPGLRAFDFGPAWEAVFPGFQAVTQKSQYDPAAGLGWQGSVPRMQSGIYPDELTCDWAEGGTFVVDLKTGPSTYVVETALDPTNMWGWTNSFASRTLKLNGKAVLDEKMDGRTFLRDRYCLFENEDDTPDLDLWKDRVSRINPIRRFEAAVAADGRLTVELTGQNMTGGMCFLVIYPKSQAKQGQAYMTALDAIRKERFDAKVNRGVPVPDGPKPSATDADTACGYMAFVRGPDSPLNCRSVPATSERRGATIQACPGERTSFQLGLYPLANVEGLTISASPLVGPKGTIPASALDIKRVRHYYKRPGWSTYLELMPLIHTGFRSLNLTPGLTQPVWVNVTVPIGTPAGEYKGTLRLAAGAVSANVPLALTVNPFALEGLDDLSISGMGTSGGNWRTWYPELEQQWWRTSEQTIALQAQHGFTALTGGPAMKVKAIKDGKAEVDFADADRWMGLARKYGLTNLGDSYQGFDDALGFGRDQSADCMKANEAAARAAYQMGFDEVTSAVYGAIARHARESSWPDRAYYLLDEPSGARVQPIGEMIAQHVKAAPGTAFSGYYAPGNKTDKRDAYYATLPLSILSTVDEGVLHAVHAGGNKAWLYANPNYANWKNLRHLFGRWLYAARQAGLDGMTLGYGYVDTIPYWDLSDGEGAWGLVYPDVDGVNSTLWLEQVSLGLNDYRYLKTLKSRVDAARKGGVTGAAIDEAARLLAEVSHSASLQNDPCAGEPLATPADFARLRRQVTRLIVALSK